jgi:hypothetical protein
VDLLYEFAIGSCRPPVSRTEFVLNVHEYSMRDCSLLVLLEARAQNAQLNLRVSLRDVTP